MVILWGFNEISSHEGPKHCFVTWKGHTNVNFLFLP